MGIGIGLGFFFLIYIYIYIYLSLIYINVTRQVTSFYDVFPWISEVLTPLFAFGLLDLMLYLLK